MPKRDRVKYNEYMRQYMLRRYHRRREAAIKLLGGKCVQCGSEDDLQFDHKDRTTKLFEVASEMASAPRKRLASELVKCQLLCAGCHIEKSKVDISAAYRERLASRG